MLRKQPKKFEELLVQWRAELEMTQAQLAHELNVSTTTVSHWESGRFRARRVKEYNVLMWAYEKGLIAESPSGDGGEDL